MRTLTLVAILGCAAVASAQTPKTYTPANPPRSDQETILNARVVSVDVPGRRLTVRGVDVKADGGRNEAYAVAMPAASRLGEVKAGMEVLLTLRGTTVVDLKVSVASRGEGGNVTRGTGTSTRRVPAGRAGTTGTSTTGATAPQAVVTPQPAAPIVGTGAPIAVGGTAGAAPIGTGGGGPGPVGPGAPVGGVIYVAPPSPVPAGTPYPTPRPVPTPLPVGTPPPVATPFPVLVPSDAPPSPATSPSPTPSPTA